MKRFIAPIIFFLVSVTLVSAHGYSLWEYYEGNLPSIQERAKLYQGNDIYTGTAEQNTDLLRILDGGFFGSLSPLPGPTSEGTTTAGWTDDGSIVRLNTSSDNVGIGTLSPSAKLQVAGAGYFTGNLSVAGGSLNLSEGTATTTLSMTSTGRIGVG